MLWALEQNRTEQNRTEQNRTELIKGYIIHVKGAYEREKHMNEQIKNLPFNFEFVLDGDKDEITPEILERYFKEGMSDLGWQGGIGAVSCTYKHFLALRDMIKNNIEFGIIFENDIFLDKNFTNAVYKALDEIKERKISIFYLSLEDSFFIFVKGSVRKKGQTVYRVYEHEYRKSHPYLISRAAGAYIVDLQAAKNIINEVDTNKCSRVSDWFFTYCASEKIIDLYYLHPTIASQGTHNGRLKSMFPNGKRRGRISYFLQKKYKQFLWRMR